LYFNQDNDGAIAELLANGPIVAAFDVYEDFYKYKGGIYQYTGGELVGGHAVRIVGYGVEKGVPYWTVANSWDYYWGESGYFRIIRGTNDCGFEDEITTATADVSRSLKDFFSIPPSRLPLGPPPWPPTARSPDAPNSSVGASPTPSR